MKKNIAKDWFNNPSFRSLAPMKQQIIIEFVNEVQGASMETAIQAFMKTNQKMHDLGLSFTQQESNLMTQILTQDLPPNEKSRINMILQMMSH